MTIQRVNCHVLCMVIFKIVMNRYQKIILLSLKIGIGSSLALFIADYVLEHSGLKVSSLYIAQGKQKCGIIERENYNKPKSENVKQSQCPPEKEVAIIMLLRNRCVAEVMRRFSLFVTFQKIHLTSESFFCYYV